MQIDDHEETEIQRFTCKGGVENVRFGSEYFEIEGEHVYAFEYFGPKWTQHIQQLYSIAPIDHPPNMNVILHDYQLKGEAVIMLQALIQKQPTLKRQCLGRDGYHCMIIPEMYWS
ncbi:hypothetical protein F5884DRAFT_323963 [Xylogone sp. PMI_703]|nr:hypothetical protein F5884DRAFT_323963 [Xylogone sp. PMI_703]